MTTSTWIFICGTVGGFCTTFAFVPQVVKIWRQGGRDLSYGMLSLYLLGVSLWLVYGILIHAAAITLTNAATFLLIAVATGLKAWTAKRDAVREGVAMSVAEQEN
jgi:MtN3 and saliva related transmembrane protein